MLGIQHEHTTFSLVPWPWQAQTGFRGSDLPLESIVPVSAKNSTIIRGSELPLESIVPVSAKNNTIRESLYLAERTM